MKCPNCGREIGKTDRCYYCGCNIVKEDNGGFDSFAVGQSVDSGSITGEGADAAQPTDQPSYPPGVQQPHIQQGDAARTGMPPQKPAPSQQQPIQQPTSPPQQASPVAGPISPPHPSPQQPPHAGRQDREDLQSPGHQQQPQPPAKPGAKPDKESEVVTQRMSPVSRDQLEQKREEFENAAGAQPASPSPEQERGSVQASTQSPQPEPQAGKPPSPEGEEVDLSAMSSTQAIDSAESTAPREQRKSPVEHPAQPTGQGTQQPPAAPGQPQQGSPWQQAQPAQPAQPTGQGTQQPPADSGQSQQGAPWQQAQPAKPAQPAGKGAQQRSPAPQQPQTSGGQVSQGVPIQQQPGFQQGYQQQLQADQRHPQQASPYVDPNQESASTGDQQGMIFEDKQQEASQFFSDSGIDVSPMDDEMEIVGTADFQLPQDSNIPVPGFASEDESVVGSEHPAFAASQWQQGGQSGAPPQFPSNGRSEPAVPDYAGDSSEKDGHTIYDDKQAQRGAYISSKRQYSGNEVIYKIIAVAMTVISFFTLRVIDTLRVGTANPYDKIFYLRLIIFAVIFTFAVYLFFVKELGKKEVKVKKTVIALAIVAFIGSFIGRTGISTSEESNFFISDADQYYRFLESGKGYAGMPVFSPNGGNVVAHYKPDPAFNAEITLLKLRLDNEESPAKVVKTGISCSRQMYWYSPTEILYPARKVNPTEPFRFRLANAFSGSVKDFYVTYNYNFTVDYDFNINTKRITAAFSNLIWLLELETNEVTVLSGLDMLLREYEVHPAASEYTSNPRGFIKGLMGNLPYITSMSFMDASPRFNQSGDVIYFTRGSQGNQRINDIYRLRLDRIIGNDVPSNLSGYQELHDYMMETSELITSDPYHYGNLAVSPGGRFVAGWIWARKDNDPSIRKNEDALVIYDVETKTPIRIFPTYPTEAYIQYADWSPDGKYIIADMKSGLNAIIVLIEVPDLIVGLDKDSLE